jgi:hypothetical protein
MTAAVPPAHYTADEIACYSDDESSFSDYSSSAVERLSASMTSMSSVDAENIVADDVRPSRVPPLATSVKINVEGAFIVDEESEGSHSPGASAHASNDHVHWENKDIRLPHHTDVVSHVAVDVSLPSTSP